MMKKNSIITVVLLVIVVSGTLVLLQYRTKPQSRTTNTNEVILQAITKDNPTFLEEGEPVIKITSVSNFDDKWYIVNIGSMNETNNGVRVKAVLMDLGNNNLKVISGPDTYFPEDRMLSRNIPDSVILELQKS